MNATPPGVDQLDPATLDPEELDQLDQHLDSAEPIAGVDAEADPQDPGTPPASPDGHHQTHSVPVATN
jgi:hypothetical protein